jgi:hypothetical protein
VAEVATTVIGRYYARMDGREPGDPLDLVAPDVQFAIVIANGAEFAGGRSELEAYVEGRDPQGRYHLLLDEQSGTDTEFVKGHVQTDEQLLGAFTATVELDEDGLIRRYLVAMSTALSFD